MNKLKIALSLIFAGSASINLFSQVVTFNYTGGVQTYTVPPCVFTLNVTVEGAEGGGSNGGDGSIVTGSIAVTPGQVLQVYVGGMGTITGGGFNGGGIGKPGSSGSGGGGGASDIRVAPYALANRVVVAGGGGGTGGGSTVAGGGSGANPSGTTGIASYGSPGTGGTATGGGTGGAPWGACGMAGGNGGLGIGGAGGTDVCYGLGPGGGGGGGRYGGGGGGADDYPSFPLGGGGGGGGSDLVPGGGSGTTGGNTGHGSITITPVGGALTVSVTPSAPSICAGGSVALTASATGAISYTWSPATGLSSTSGATVTASPAVTTTYTVTASTGTCTGTATVTVTVNPLPAITCTPAAPAICSGSSVALTASGASTYSWSPATGLSGTTGATVTSSATTTTTYTITGTSAAGCVNTGSVTVTVNPNPTVSCTPAAPSICTGGSVALTGSGASTYSWSPATGLSATTGTTVTASPAATTTYTITGTSAAGCTGTATVTVTVNPTPTITCTPATPSICSGGSVSLTAGGASTYSWSPATGLSGTTGTTVTATPAATTTYTITGTSSAGCVNTGTVTVTVNPLPTITCTPAAPAICSGSSVTLTAGGASTYAWSPGTGLSGTTGATVISSATTTTTYTITGTSAAGCVNTGTVTVTVNPLPTITCPSASICAGGSATLTASGAVSYTWSPATGLSATTGTTVTASPAATTTYTITGTDINGCVNTGTTTVTITPQLDATITPAGPFCQNNGAVTLTAVDGGGTWSATCGTCITSATGVFDPATASVGANTITYTITGSCGDTQTTTITVNAVPDVTATPATSTICSGTATNIALTSSVGGTTFNWTESSTNVTGASAASGATIAQTLTAASAPGGSVTYTITPSTATCTGNPVTATVTVEDVVINSINTTNVSCFGLSDGTITVNATGAATYNDGTTTQASNIFTEPAGTYTITVSSPNGCTATGFATITEPTALVVPTSQTNESCFGACDGVAGTAPTGGTAPYSYAWTGTVAGSVPFVSSLCSGAYSVTVTDANGCSLSANYTITGPPAVSITSVVPTSPSCNGGSNGTVVVNASASAVTYVVGPFTQTTNTFTGMSAGTYTVTVSDAAGCTATTTTTVTQPSALGVNSGPASTICFGQSATVSATGTGATPGYTYTWTDAGGATVGTSASTLVAPTTPGTNVYTVSVNDNNGCGPVTTTVTVTMSPPLTVAASPDQSVCPGSSATINTTTASGGTGTYTYAWTNSADGSVLNGASQTVTPVVSPITYTITLSDGCSPSVTDQVTVNWYTLPAVTYLINGTQGCTPVTTSFSSTTAAGATATYSWNFGDGSTSTLAAPTHTFVDGGCYDISLTIITSDGCQVDTIIPNQVCVYEYPVPDFVSQPQTATVFDPEITFANMTLGGSTFDWDFGGLGTSTVSNPVFVFPSLQGGVYNVCLTATSANGCAAQVCHEVTIKDEFLIYTPNSFTPDGDGINDIFIPVMQGFDPARYEFLVFDRWGEVIFKTTDYTQGWDGMHKGIKSKEDVYVWKVRTRKIDVEETMDFEGHVNLLR
ncbi:MAG TPA: PKD domain-containing protein [Flavobacteriales bacterium]|nr:PKD domain-containing protein [Flavobacteriales bacterium]